MKVIATIEKVLFPFMVNDNLKFEKENHVCIISHDIHPT